MPDDEDAVASFRGLMALVEEERIDDARARCRELLAVTPDDVNVLAMLGAIMIRSGDAREGERLLQRAVALEPAFAKPHEDLGMLYLQDNRPDAAEQALRTAVALEPDQASAWLGLATALARGGNHVEADQAEQKFMRLSPSAQALAGAARLYREGQAERAGKMCAELIIREPRNVRVLRLLARIAADAGRDAAAEGLLRRIVALTPGHYLSHNDLAQFLGERSRFHEAVEALREALTLKPADAGMQLRLADTLSVVGRSQEALEAYDKCLEIEPDNIPGLLGRGHMLRILGRRDAAAASYLRCTELDEATGDAWWNLASMKGYRFGAEQVHCMRVQVAKAGLDEHATIAMHFALARAAEADGSFDQAWQHYCRGNAAKRRLTSYDPVENETQNDVRITIFTRDFLDRPAATPADGGIPIFIVGMPRSGSTLIEQILASHSQVTGCGELPYIVMLAAALGGIDAVTTADGAAMRELSQRYLKLSKVHRSASASHFTDKMPANFQHVGLIHMMLPQARIIDARRNPLDTCIGNFRQLFAQGKNQSYDLQEIGEYYLEYVRLMDHWHAVLPGRVLEVRYEDVVSDLEGQVRRMLDYCGLPFEAACLDFHQSTRPVNTASSEQVREPVYTDAVGFWKNYDAALDDLREVLAPVLSRASRPASY